MTRNNTKKPTGPVLDVRPVGFFVFVTQLIARPERDQERSGGGMTRKQEKGELGQYISTAPAPLFCSLTQLIARPGRD